MATLTAVKLPTRSRADDTLPERLQSEEAITINDGVVVLWADGTKKPNRQLHSLAGLGALGGGLWSLLFGLIFVVPLPGIPVGAVAGASAASMHGVGNDDVNHKMRRKVATGTSALFTLSSDAVPDQVAAAFNGSDGELLHTNLSREQEAQLCDVFAEPEAV